MSGQGGVPPAADADFRAVQYAFAAYLRNPQQNPPPAGIEERRLAVYRELFFNNIRGFADRFFPVLRSLYDEVAWLALVRDFYVRHRCHSPYFLEIAEEFLHYLQHEREPQPEDPPFAAELAHFEWLELVVDVAEEEEVPLTGYDPDGDLLAGVPVLTPALVLAAYQWPVHRIGRDFRPQEPLATPQWLAVYRDREENVRFLAINAATARLLELLRADDVRSGLVLAGQLAAELSHPEPAALAASVGDILATLRTRGLVLGSRPGPA